MSDTFVLETRQLTKRFPGVMANDHVDLSVARGEIRAIMGENGAGKSTLCNMLTGILSPTEGEIYFCGQPVSFSHPQDALRTGIHMVYQERNLIEYLTGAQSICLGQEDRKGRFFVDERKMQKRAVQICQEIGADVPLNVPVEHLSPAQQQMIEIIRAVAHEPKVLILDEPTASLGNAEVNILFDVMRKLKKSGVSILIITHKLDEVLEISDTISIMRDGVLVGTVTNGSVDRMDIIRMMLGKDVSGQFPPVVNTAIAQRMLEVEGISDETGRIKNISLTVNKGEVVGIYGLLGAGRTEILECIYGLRKVTAGTIKIADKAQSGKCIPEDMIREGVFLIPEDRHNRSIFKDFFNLRENLSIGYLHRISNRIKCVSKRAEKKLFADIASRPELRISYSRDGQDINELSGGNQQKVVLGRWVYRESLKLLLMDEPTQGIDVGVKHDIYVLIRSMAAQGKAILMVSSELPELTGVCDRLYILKDGRIEGELNRGEFDNNKILEMVL